MFRFCFRKRVLFCVWGAIMFVIVRLLLDIPLRHLWGSWQLTGELTANVCSIIAVTGVALPVLSARKQLRGLGLMQFVHLSRRYLWSAHLLVATLTVYTALGFHQRWDIPVQFSGFLFFVAGCYWLFHMQVE